MRYDARHSGCHLQRTLRYDIFSSWREISTKHKQLAVDLREFVEKSIVSLLVKMSTEEDFRLREIQREYLDFLDDDVSASLIFDRCCVLVLAVKCH